MKWLCIISFFFYRFITCHLLRMHFALNNKTILIHLLYFQAYLNVSRRVIILDCNKIIVEFEKERVTLDDR